MNEMNEAKPEVSRGRGISPIWIIPIVAVVLGLWMVVHTFMTEGPEIEIRFDTAQGLEAGKTKVKFRNVQVGLVEDVALTDDLEGVLAHVKLDREVADMLREDTRFWVVTARLGGGTISGLDTVISGAYIQMSPGDGEPGARKFDALDAPPLTPVGTSGIRVTLFSDKGSSVSTGDSVLFNGYKVGRVESMEFDPEQRQMQYKLFIDAPFHTLVNSSVRFWDVSGISFKAGADGVRVNVGALDTVLLGGVAFGVPPGLPPGKEIQADTSFKLYSSYEDTMANPYRYGVYYVVSFAQSLRGLLPGAPVEYRGIPIGRVERIMIEESVAFSAQRGGAGAGAPLPVLIYMEPGRLEMPDLPESLELFQRSVERGVGNGMRASLSTGSLVTGSKYIDIDYFPDAEEASLGTFAEYTTIPTISTGLQQVEQKLFTLLDKFNALPLEGTVESATAALDNLSDTLDSLKVVLDPEAMKALVANLNGALADLRQALEGFSPDSELYRNLNANLADLDRVVKNLDSVTDTLAKKPNAMVTGAKVPADPIPEARP